MTSPGEMHDDELTAVRVLIAHQRRDIGGCICGWGLNTGDLGRSHSRHILSELQAAGLRLAVQ